MFFFAGCAGSPDQDSKYLLDLRLAADYYKRGKYEEAMRKYEDAIEKNPKGYGAIVGLACSDREWGLKKFEEAENLFLAKKVDLAKKEFDKAVAVHAAAQKLFQKAIQLKPEEMIAYRELGSFYYKRATSPWNFPYRLDDPKRQKERDLAIEYLGKVVKKEPDTMYAQRDLGLALFAAGKSSQGRVHLEIYLAKAAEGREFLRKNAPKSTPDQREEAEKRLRAIDEDLLKICDMLIMYLKELEEKQADAARTGATELADTLQTEILAVRNLLGKYRETREKKPEENKSG
ncbi:MAG: tetratricopeptide repeat protein [Planctomycetes bacterium]|nr:tetratricopeptide repeat protein [Planctomycetota bacterium]